MTKSIAGVTIPSIILPADLQLAKIFVCFNAFCNERNKYLWLSRYILEGYPKLQALLLKVHKKIDGMHDTFFDESKKRQAEIITASLNISEGIMLYECLDYRGCWCDIQIEKFMQFNGINEALIYAGLELMALGRHFKAKSLQLQLHPGYEYPRNTLWENIRAIRLLQFSEISIMLKAALRSMVDVMRKLGAGRGDCTLKMKQMLEGLSGTTATIANICISRACNTNEPAYVR